MQAGEKKSVIIRMDICELGQAFTIKKYEQAVDKNF